MKCHNCNQLILPYAAKYVTETIIEAYCVVCGVTSCYMEIKQ